MITQTREDYLRAMIKVTNQGAFRNRDLVEQMGLAKSTVTERLQGMAQDGLVDYKKYGQMHFTPKGKKLAQKLTYKHRIIEVFLHAMLGFSKDEVHDQAHALEHAFSDEAIRRLAKTLGNPEYDPHGKKIWI